MNAAGARQALPASSGASPCEHLTAGIGLRQAHYAELLQGPALTLPFVEVHSENFFGAGGAAAGVLRAARERWPVSLHGVGLSLGSAVGLDAWHLEQLVALVERIDPVRISDHACFARAATPGPIVHAADLLPLAFNETSLDIMVRHVHAVQERLRRPILVENISAYLRFEGDTLAEPEFFNLLSRRTGCGVLLDVNNLVVNAWNEDRSRGAARDEGDTSAASRREAAAVAKACRWIDALDVRAVGEIHLAGYDDAGELAIDDHGSCVRASVWQVFEHAIRRVGPVPTLIEWDNELPALSVLLAEADAAGTRLAACAEAGS